MGREATCHCQWSGVFGQCRVLLESNELILRGAISRRTLISSLTHVFVQGGELHLQVGEEAVVLTLGADLAKRWAEKIATPPPTLATKLGISPTTRLLLVGEFATDELERAIAQAATTDGKNPNLILAGVRVAADLDYALDVYAHHPSNPPIWIIYRKGTSKLKGPGKLIGETEIRTLLRQEGFIDTKVASVSASLTALRFIKQAHARI